jgi:hypothetical protein
MNPLLIILLLSAGAFYLTQGVEVSEKEILRCSIKVLSLDSIKFDGRLGDTLRLSIGVDNPTNYTFSTKQVNVKLLYEDSEVSNSSTGNIAFGLKANERTLISNVQIGVSYISDLNTDSLFEKNKKKEWKLEVSATIKGVEIKNTKTYKITDLLNLKAIK